MNNVTMLPHACVRVQVDYCTDIYLALRYIRYIIFNIIIIIRVLVHWYFIYVESFGHIILISNAVYVKRINLCHILPDSTR